MEQLVITLLQKVDRRLGNIETQVFKQNDRINAYEKTVKLLITGRNSQDLCTDFVRETKQCKNDNFINQMKAELNSAENTVFPKQRTRTKVRKAASFQEKSATRKPIRIRRNPHTVPSDKDEEMRFKSFRRECLSKAIQWNLVDMINASTGKHNIVLPKWLDKEEVNFVREGKDCKDHLRRFLCVLKEREFGMMQEWLNNCEFEEDLVKQVWDTFTEFSDVNVNKSLMKCFRCRLIENVSVVDVADYLFSADILKSKQLYFKICSSERPVGTQDELWEVVLQECSKHEYLKVVVVAIKVALTDKKNAVCHKDSDAYESLLNEIQDITAQDILACSCSERCAKSFHPVSCLKTMSMAGVYFSPPTERKRENVSSSEIPSSTASSCSSAEAVGGSDPEQRLQACRDTVSADEETFIKNPSAVEKENVCGKGENSSLKMPHARPRSLRRKKVDRGKKQTLSESSSENLHDRKTDAIEVRNEYKVTNTSTHMLENKPNVINAKNVYFDSGPKYYQIKKGTSGSSSSEH